MNDQRLSQLLRDAEANAPAVQVHNPTGIAMSARLIRRQRQQRTRVVICASLVLMLAAGSFAMIGWRNVERGRRADHQLAVAALRDEAARLDIEAADRIQVVQAVARSTKAGAKISKPKSKTPRDISFDLEQERERAAAIILQAADQLRDAGRADLANDRYHDLITLFPNTAATELARERLEHPTNRT